MKKTTFCLKSSLLALALLAQAPAAVAHEKGQLHSKVLKKAPPKLTGERKQIAITKKDIERLHTNQSTAYKHAQAKIKAKAPDYPSNKRARREYTQIESLNQQFNEVYARYRMEIYKEQNKKDKPSIASLKKFYNTLDKLQVNFQKALKKKDLA